MIFLPQRGLLIKGLGEEGSTCEELTPMQENKENDSDNRLRDGKFKECAKRFC